ncbi:hypothetical protein FD755_022520 [Muntiacus reevesi]|uniref:Cell cycle checkpoint protein RAD1 n=1 Tax=Muntiacus reevesi TaxID=9886 RepID=A0A5N3W0Q0_MUNRE|nr:hypothetical protein FD755_022520 [Muntiacus reevesi]
MPLLTQRITDENDYCLVASLDNVRNLSTILKAGIFQEFRVQEESVTFRINLTVLLDCLLSTFGNAGSSHLDYPKDSDLMESFHCNQTQALVLSCKVSIRTDNRGFLSLQYMIRNEDGQICFVEYYCCPDEEVPDS